MKKETENKIIELHEMVEGFGMDYRQKSLIRDKINEILACEGNDRKVGKVDLYDYVIATEDIAEETGLDVARVNSYLEQMEECEDGFHYCCFIEQFRGRGVEMCEFRWDNL